MTNETIDEAFTKSRQWAGMYAATVFFNAFEELNKVRQYIHDDDEAQEMLDCHGKTLYLEFAVKALEAMLYEDEEAKKEVISLAKEIAQD